MMRNGSEIELEPAGHVEKNVEKTRASKDGDPGNGCSYASAVTVELAFSDNALWKDDHDVR